MERFYKEGQDAALEKLGVGPLLAALGGVAARALPWLAGAATKAAPHVAKARAAWAGASPLTRHMLGGAGLGAAGGALGGGEGGMMRGALLGAAGGAGMYGLRRGLGMAAQQGLMSPQTMRAYGAPAAAGQLPAGVRGLLGA